MIRHFRVELEKLKKRILALGAMVEDRVRLAIKATSTRDGELAEKIIKLDYEINEAEVETEEECLRILALYQPVAADLRFITAVIKINNDLERIGDEAVNIAERVVILSKRPDLANPFDYTEMGQKAETMLKYALDSLVNRDSDLAYKVFFLDDEVDELKNQVYDVIKDTIRDQAENAGFLINLLLISRHLERIADLSTNIAEEVVYMIEGEILRHKNEKL